MNKRKIILIAAAAALMVVAVFAVAYLRRTGGSKPVGGRTISIGGSTSGLTLLSSVIKPFELKNPGVAVEVIPGTETSDAVRGVGRGLLDIGSAARPLKDSEKGEYPDVAYLGYARDAMVLAVNSKTEVSNLTSEQVRKIYSGEIANWKDVGGQDAPIVVLDREESESSKIVLRKEILGEGLVVTPKAMTFFSASSMNKGIETIENSIGQTSLSGIKLLGLDAEPLAVDGVAPSPESIRSGAYKMVRNFGVLISKTKAGDAARDFVDYLFSPEGRALLSGVDLVPIGRGETP